MVGGEIFCQPIPPCYRKKVPSISAKIQSENTGPLLLYTQSVMSISKTETDVILNRANVALARSQRLVASWLPPPTDAEQANAKSEEELQKEEDEIFIAVPETYVYVLNVFFEDRLCMDC